MFCLPVPFLKGSVAVNHTNSTKFFEVEFIEKLKESKLISYRFCEKSSRYRIQEAEKRLFEPILNYCIKLSYILQINYMI